MMSFGFKFFPYEDEMLLRAVVPAVTRTVYGEPASVTAEHSAM